MGKKATSCSFQYLLVVGILSQVVSAYAQHSPTQEWKGKIGETLEESIPYPLVYNPKAPEGAPNIVWVLIDDAGFGASTAFGGLVETPNFAKLANAGLRYTNFHTTAICSPTRAALLTGRNPHSAHVGLLTPTVMDFPGYDMRIPFEKATVAEILRENGYNTFAVGKWHVTPVEESSPAGPFNRWPTGRGFDQFYGFLLGAVDQWHPVLWENQTKLELDPTLKTPHLNQLLADKAIRYIANQKSADPDKPFFLYFAPGATHSPHQVAKEWIDKYKGKFDMGWDRYREIVLANQKKLGLVPANVELPEPNPGVKAWNALSPKEQEAYAYFMEVYAAFYTYTDHEIGRVVDYLEQIDELDNTLIVLILGDNGASRGGSQHGTIHPSINRLQGEERIEAILEAREFIGTDYSNTDYPIGWASAMNTPFRYWKVDANMEGGTRNPLIIYYPKLIKEGGGIRHQYSHVIDVLPTTLDIVKANIPPVINGYSQDPIEGTSLFYSIHDADAESKHTVQYYEIAGVRAIYKDGWKASTAHDSELSFQPGLTTGSSDFNKDTWQLYNLNDDFNERFDLAEKLPGKLKELQQVFHEEAKKYNVYPLKDFSVHDMYVGRSAYGKKSRITLYPGVDNLNDLNSPLYSGRSFNVLIEAEINDENDEGVLFAVGGQESGISIFIQDKKLQYAHKASEHVDHVIADVPLPKGKIDVELVYTYQGTGEANGVAGNETLLLNGKEVGRRAFSASESTIQIAKRIDGTDVGRDQYFTVSDKYNAPYPFTGKIKKVTITYPDQL